MGKAIDMKAAETPSTTPPADKDSKDAPAAPPSVSEQLAAIAALLETSVKAKETRVIVGRLLRQTNGVRKQLSADNLADFIRSTLPDGYQGTQLLLSHLNKATGAMETDGHGDQPAANAAGASAVGLLPEVEAYAYLLVVLFLVDGRHYPEAKAVAGAGVKRAGEFNRRTLDGLAARLYFYLSLAHERTGTLPQIRSQLLGLHRTAVLRHDEYGAETLLNLLLRNYLDANLYDQAEKLRSKAVRSEVSRSGAQLARYLYYLGRIRAVQLDYSEAKDCLQQAARKAPMAATGFRVEVGKWLALVRLLLGEVPEHSEFTALGLAAPLAAYFGIAQAVRAGDLTAFREVAEKHAGVFAADKTQNLIVRLQYNVIRAGLRRINLAYSRISLADVASRLDLASVADTECIVAKAIRDGGVDAVLDHGQSCMRSKDTPDVYATAEPASAFHARVAFCLDIHNEAVRAMRFDAGANRRKLEDADSTRERAIAEEELAKAYEEEEEGGL